MSCAAVEASFMNFMQWTVPTRFSMGHADAIWADCGFVIWTYDCFFEHRESGSLQACHFVRRVNSDYISKVQLDSFGEVGVKGCWSGVLRS